MIVQEQDDSTEPVVQDLLLVTTDVSSIVNTKLPRVRIRRRGTFPTITTKGMYERLNAVATKSWNE